jgi:hypothetical protein
MANQLYTVKRITDGKFAEIRIIADGQLQLYWTANVREATALIRAKAQALAALMAIGAAPFAETIIIEEAQ